MKIIIILEKNMQAIKLQQQCQMHQITFIELIK